MKFIISENEARGIISSRYNLPAGTRVIISRPRSKEGVSGTARAVVEQVEKFLPGNLIGAIKELRVAGNYTLADAKNAVDNWPHYKEVLFRTRTWPVRRCRPDLTSYWDAGLDSI